MERGVPSPIKILMALSTERKVLHRVHLVPCLVLSCPHVAIIQTNTHLVNKAPPVSTPKASAKRTKGGSPKKYVPFQFICLPAEVNGPDRRPLDPRVLQGRKRELRKPILLCMTRKPLPSIAIRPSTPLFRRRYIATPSVCIVSSFV